MAALGRESLTVDMTDAEAKGMKRARSDQLRLGNRDNKSTQNVEPGSHNP